MALGAPFFRNYKIILDYSNQQVLLYNKTVTSPITPLIPYDESASFDISMSVDADTLQYYGSIEVGTPEQTGSAIAFST